MVDQTDDPFWDPMEAHQIGQGFLKLVSLGYLIDNPVDLTLVGDHGACGTLKVNLIPTDEKGEKNLSEDQDTEAIESPEELLGKKMHFKVVIDGARLPENFCTDTYVEYSILENGKNYVARRTEQILGKNYKPDYKYS